MPITLITGGNKGLGYETARRLIAEGHQVYLGARDSGRGQRAADQLGARFVQLDVTDDASVAAAADELARQAGRLDVLINNAGIAGPLKPVAELVVDPGYTATDLNAHDGRQTVSEGTDAIVAMASIGADGPTGTFTDRHGAVAW